MQLSESLFGKRIFDLGLQKFWRPNSEVCASKLRNLCAQTSEFVCVGERVRERVREREVEIEKERDIVCVREIGRV